MSEKFRFKWIESGEELSMPDKCEDRSIRLGRDEEFTFHALGIEQWAKENPLKFQELSDALCPDYELPLSLPDEFDAVFIYSDDAQVKFWYKGITITVDDNTVIRITKKLNYGDMVTIRIR
jgi:hypothetical protein